MSTELKTLKELADEVGFPFEAKHNDMFRTFVCVALTPSKDVALGWYKSDGMSDSKRANISNWTLVTPKKKLVEFLYETRGMYQTAWLTEEDRIKFIKDANATCLFIFREVEL